MPLAFDFVRGRAGTNAGLALTRLAPALQGQEWSGHLRGVAEIPTPAAYTDHFDRIRARTAAGAPQRAVLLAKAESPTICGMGERTPGENGLTLHPVYGVPYLPGTSLKGILRAWVLSQDWGADWREEGVHFHSLFGAGGDSGSAAGVDILDALMVPSTGTKPLQMDVLTPHFAKYYQGTEDPKGWDGPNPVLFMVAPMGQTYRIVLEGPQPWLSKAAEWLALALAERGVGAKSRAGYGRFSSMPLDKDDSGEQKAARRALGARQSPTDRVFASLLERGQDAVRGELEKWLLGEPVAPGLAGSLSQPANTIPRATKDAIARLGSEWKLRTAWAKRLADANNDSKRARAQSILSAWDTLMGPPPESPQSAAKAAPPPPAAQLRHFTDSDLRTLVEAAREKKGVKWSKVGGNVGRNGDDDSLERARALAAGLGASTADLASFRRYP
jgi:CRISPR-associated protein Cmr6